MRQVSVLTGALLMSFAGVGSVIAQNNTILIDQGNPIIGTTGNTLVVDQSAASNSLVAGAEPDQAVQTKDIESPAPLTAEIINSAAPAVQFGSGNSASITLSGDGGVAGLNQLGNDNNAIINVDGLDASGSVFQNGDRNAADLLVSSSGASGALIQIGNDNNTRLSVSGSANASVSFTLEGNGVTTTVPATVSSIGGGQVTIIQRQLNTFTTP